jgi:hypothetical protein
VINSTNIACRPRMVDITAMDVINDLDKVKVQPVRPDSRTSAISNPQRSIEVHMVS